MRITKVDKANRFVSQFDPSTGFYMRTGVVDERGVDTGVDPFMTSFPELIDVGVMGWCKHGVSGLCAESGVQCYQDGLHRRSANMSLDDFKRIVDECKGRVYQLALGGRGDVDQHESFEAILSYCRENNIVPNFTTSGLGLTVEKAKICASLCGAVAVSEYRQPHTLRAINRLLDAGVKTNIHYVLGNNSIDEAIDRLERHDFPTGVNAIIFLLHKPVGQGTQENVLRVDDPRVARFFDLIDGRLNDLPFKVGFDSCTVPGILRFTRKIDRASIDTCEAARWSMYITSDMKALPCSFDQKERWAFDISNDTIQNAWTSPQFEAFRNVFHGACGGCSMKTSCLGGCPITNEIVLCDSSERR